jgi:hypothetical protein
MIPKYINEIVYSKELLFGYEVFKYNSSLNFRSDEFKKNHDGLHILFNGCSCTQGDGLLLEEMWSKKVYEKINKIKKCSGYYNIALSGTSVMNQIILFFKYFKAYGNPNIIFFNITDNLRFYIYDEKNYKNAFFEKESKNIINLLIYQYYFMLDQYCKANNIKLFTFTWIGKVEGYEDEEYEKILNKFDSFYKIDQKELLNFIFEYKELNKDKSFAKYIERARDNDHPGIASNEYWANFIYKKYMESL